MFAQFFMQILFVISYKNGEIESDEVCARCNFWWVHEFVDCYLNFIALVNLFLISNLLHAVNCMGNFKLESIDAL